MQNTDARLILTAEVTKTKMAKTSKIYLNKFARYFGLQHKPSSGAERKKLQMRYMSLACFVQPLGKVCVANRNNGQICLNIF